MFGARIVTPSAGTPEALAANRGIRVSSPGGEAVHHRSRIKDLLIVYGATTPLDDYRGETIQR